MPAAIHRTQVLVIGAGLAGIATALELLDLGQRVLLVDGGPRGRIGGQANDAFGGMLLAGTPEQRRGRIADSPELLLSDWLRVAGFGPGDIRARQWAEAYAYRCRPDIYDWLRARGVGFVPMVQWPERGNHGDGNSLPRYHIAWGCGLGIAQELAARLLAHPRRDRLQCLFEHRVTALSWRDGAVAGCEGRAPTGDFRIKAEQVVACGGGIGGNLDLVRRHWDPVYGPCPDDLLAGAHPSADGSLHEAVRAGGGQVVNLGWMWNYAAGIAHPDPEYPRHGLSLIPPRSALWLDRHGRRVGPMPLVGGFDTHDLCRRMGHLPGQYGWLLMNRRIALRELAVSGSAFNPLFRDRRPVRLLWQALTGDRRLLHWLASRCPDVLQANDLDSLAAGMEALAGDARIDRDGMRRDVAAYDGMIRRGTAFHNDEQLRLLRHVRQWRGDRLRTCRFQPIDDRRAGPLLAIRVRLIARKSMGGMLTDLSSRVLGADGAPVPGLYAAGEAAGFGGGGIAGRRSLEGTFLSACILTGRRAAQAIAGRAHDTASHGSPPP